MWHCLYTIFTIKADFNSMEKLLVTQLIKKFPTFYGGQREAMTVMPSCSGEGNVVVA
jgi:hypothetical protein